MIDYNEFTKKLKKKISSDAELHYSLLVNVVKNPIRYTGIFRVSNTNTKLIQNVTQSQEIKFGDFMEEIVTDYIAKMGYTNLDKVIGSTAKGEILNADQIFKKDQTIYLIEQKIRDDHDSTKKRGQYDNFQKKYQLLKTKFPKCKIVATMWFIDDNFKKNRKYYIERAKKEKLSNVSIDIVYGEDLFNNLFGRIDVWNEICAHLLKNKLERSNEMLTIPNFDTSPEMHEAIIRLKNEKPALYKKLMSDKPRFIRLREELFPTGKNLKA